MDPIVVVAIVGGAVTILVALIVPTVTLFLTLSERRDKTRKDAKTEAETAKREADAKAVADAVVKAADDAAKLIIANADKATKAAEDLRIAQEKSSREARESALEIATILGGMTIQLDGATQKIVNASEKAARLAGIEEGREEERVKQAKIDADAAMRKAAGDAAVLADRQSVVSPPLPPTPSVPPDNGGPSMRGRR